MFKRLCSTAIVFGAAALAPPLAEAQTLRCLPRDALVEKLQDDYDEALTGGGLQSPRQILEVWSSDKTGTFTVFFTRANGVSCIVATGQNWNSYQVSDDDDGLAG